MMPMGTGSSASRDITFLVLLVRINTNISNKLEYGGLGNSVGIATDNGLNVPGWNTGGDEIFRPSRPALRHTQPPAKWVPRFSVG